jgi:hypothetical protein
LTGDTGEAVPSPLIALKKARTPAKAEKRKSFRRQRFALIGTRKCQLTTELVF